MAKARAEGTKTATAMIEIPLVAEDEAGYAARAFNFRVSQQEADKLRTLRQALHRVGVTFADRGINRHVDRTQDVFRWMLSQIEVA